MHSRALGITRQTLCSKHRKKEYLEDANSGLTSCKALPATEAPLGMVADWPDRGCSVHDYAARTFGRCALSACPPVNGRAARDIAHHLFDSTRDGSSYASCGQAYTHCLSSL